MPRDRTLSRGSTEPLHKPNTLRSGLFALPIWGMILASAAMGQTADPVARLLEQLTAQGYAIEEVTRTWLGRVRIEAVRGGFEREIVIDPRNGLILRDAVEPDDFDDDDEDSSPAQSAGGNGSGGGNDDPGEPDGPDDDEDDDDRDDDDDEDDGDGDDEDGDD